MIYTKKPNGLNTIATIWKYWKLPKIHNGNKCGDIMNREYLVEIFPVEIQQM